jgi:hypothetical protein
MLSDYTKKKKKKKMKKKKKKMQNDEIVCLTDSNIQVSKWNA